VPSTVVEFAQTPNPDAIKVVVTPSPAPDAPRSYREAPSPAADPLAAALMALPGVRNLLIHDGWLSVGKDPGTAWSVLKPAIRRVLESRPEGAA
jgi:hypothetical protein